MEQLATPSLAVGRADQGDAEPLFAAQADPSRDEEAR
jgi:hypothetical protein